MAPRTRLPRRLLATTVATGSATILLSLASVAPAAAATSCPDADLTTTALGPDRSVAAVSCVVNRERNAVGLPALSWSPALALAAQRHASTMADQNFFAHEEPSGLWGVEPGDRITAVGYVWAQIGENIAVGQQTPRAVANAWIQSPGHCVNLMDPGVTDVGIALDPRGTIGLPGPVWSQELARPQSIGAPGGTAPSCPRTPLDPSVPVTPIAPVGANPVNDAPPASTAPPAAPAAPTPTSASFARQGRTVVARLRGTPRGTVVARVVQRSWKGPRVRIRLSASGTAKQRLRLRWAGKGQVLVTSGTTRSTVRFR